MTKYVVPLLVKVRVRVSYNLRETLKIHHTSFGVVYTEDFSEELPDLDDEITLPLQVAVEAENEKEAVQKARELAQDGWKAVVEIQDLEGEVEVVEAK